MGEYPAINWRLLSLADQIVAEIYQSINTFTLRLSKKNKYFKVLNLKKNYYYWNRELHR